MTEDPQKDPKYNIPLNLDDEAVAVEALMSQRYKRWAGRPYDGLEQSLRRWAFVVSGIVNNRSPGYFDSEYQNDLQGRQGLAEMLQAAEQLDFAQLLQWAIPLVDEIDETFRQHSFVDTNHYVFSQNRLTPDYWFLRRLPKHQGVIDSYENAGPIEVEAIRQRPDFGPKK